MKTIITIVLLSAGLIYSQTISDSTQMRNKNQEKEKIQNQNSELKQIQDQTGPKQNQQAEVKENRKKKDVFIDKDGDGICDTRQSGMSFNKMRKRLGSGKNGPGGQGGSGNGNNGNSNGYGGGN
jgi:cytochrome c biogenesis factor